jgi:hypothetical protein
VRNINRIKHDPIRLCDGANENIAMPNVKAVRLGCASKVVSLAEVKRRKERSKIIAQYIAFYGTTYDNQRKETKQGEKRA